MDTNIKINPITGKPITDPTKPIKAGTTVASNPEGKTTTVGVTIPPRWGANPNINPITGQAIARPKSDLIFDGINNSAFDFSGDITNKEGQGSAAQALADGIDIQNTSDWEEQRARNQGPVSKFFSSLANKFAITALTTAGEGIFGSVTGATYAALTGATKDSDESDKRLSAYITSFMEKDSKYAINPSLLDRSDFTLENLSLSNQTLPYDEDSVKKNILDSIWGSSDPNNMSEGNIALQEELAKQGINKDNIFQALEQARDQKSGILGITPSMFSNDPRYNAPGTMGAKQILGKYEEAVRAAAAKAVVSDGNGMRDVAAAYWDTPLGRTMDDIREWGDKTFPFRYTREEQELAENSVNWVPFTDGSFNFYFDKVASGVGFAAGAFAPAYLTKGKGAGAIGYRMGKNLYGRVTGKPNIGAAAATLEREAAATQGIRSGEGAAEMTARLRNPSRVDKFKKQFNDSQKLVGSAYLASYAEAAVESRDVQKQFIEQETAKWMAENPGKSEMDMPPDVRERIQQLAKSAGNTNFAMQMPMLIGTNLFTLGSIMKFKALAPMAERLGLAAGEGIAAAPLAREAGKTVEKFWFNSKAGRVVEKGVRGVGKVAPGAVSEGAQEGYQYFAQKYSLGYYGDRIVDDEAHLSRNFAEAMNKTLNDTESLEQMVIGAMIGGGMSAYGARKNSKKSKEATEKVMAIMNSGVLSNMVQRTEMSSESKAMMKDYTDKLQKGDTAGARDALFNLIANEARVAEDFGSKDLYNEMLDDLAKMSPEDFVKFAMPEAGAEFASNLTQDSVREIANDVKEKFNRASEIRKGILERFPLPKRSSGLEKVGMSQRQIDDEELQIKAMSAYRDILYSAAIDVEGADGSIQAIMENLQDIVPGLDIDILKMKIKAGDVKVAEDGKAITMDDVQSVMGTAVDKKTQEQLSLYLRSLDPDQREKVLNDFTRLLELAGRRNIAMQAYDELRKSPNKSTLYYKALQADRQAKTEKYRNDVAEKLLATAQSSRALINSLPMLKDPAIKARVRTRIKELKTQESKIRKDKFANMTIDQMRQLNYDGMSEIEKTAYDTALTYKKNREIRDNIVNRVNKTLASNPSGVYNLSALFKGMSKDKDGAMAVAAAMKQIEETLRNMC